MYVMGKRERDYAPEQESEEWMKSEAHHQLARTKRERANKRKNGIADSILSEKQNMKRGGEMKCLHKWCAAEKDRETIARTLVIANTDQMVARLPIFKHVKRTIQRQRIVHDLPKIPHDKTF